MECEICDEEEAVGQCPHCGQMCCEICLEEHDCNGDEE